MEHDVLLTRLRRSFGYRSGEFSVCQLFASTDTGQIRAIHTHMITKPVTSPSKLTYALVPYLSPQVKAQPPLGQVFPHGQPNPIIPDHFSMHCSHFSQEFT